MSGSWKLEGDWYDGDIPASVEMGREVYIESAYAFSACQTQQRPGIVLGDCCGVYERSAIVTGQQGVVRIGPYTCLNASYLICHKRILIGAHCFFAWGVVVTDTEPDRETTVSMRRAALKRAAVDSERCFPQVGVARPVTVEDNVWIGFDSVVRPGVRIGRGSVVGCKSIVAEEVPPYSIVVGNPARVVRKIEPTDTDAARQQALREYRRAKP